MSERSRFWMLLAVGTVVLALAGGAGWWYSPWNAEQRYRHTGLVELHRRTQREPNDRLAWRELGLRLARDGDGPQAEPALRRALALKLDDPEVATGLGELLVARGATEEAFQLLRGTVGRSPAYLPARLALGRFYRQRGSYHNAAEQFESITRQSSEYPDAYFELGRCYLQMQQVARAREAISQALTLAPREPQYLVLQASILTAVGEIDGAVRSLEAAASIAPQSRRVQSSLALVLLTHTRSPADLDLAAHAIDRLRALDGKHRLLPYVDGRLALARRRWPEAVTHLERAREVAPEQDEVFYALSQAYRGAGRVEEADRALAHFRRRQTLRRETDELLIRLTTSPDRVDYHLRLAELQLEARDAAAAGRSLAAAASLAPRSPADERRLKRLRARLAVLEPAPGDES
jgi:Flp pilus assembly protein TadD